VPKKGTDEIEAEDKVGKDKKRGKVDSAVLHRASGIPDTLAVPPYHLSCLGKRYCSVNT
jgi:hypothetical protein